jgi:hypothetical protein
MERSFEPPAQLQQVVAGARGAMMTSYLSEVLPPSPPLSPPLPLQLYMMTSYLSEVLDIIWFFINYRRCLTYLNFAILPLTAFTTVTCVLGAMLAYGVPKSVLPLMLCVAV